MRHVTPKTILVSLAGVVVFAIAVGGPIVGALRYFEEKGVAQALVDMIAGASALAQAQSAVQLQVVAKESRKRDIEAEIREIDNRKKGNATLIGDQERRRDLEAQRNAIITRLETLK